MDNKKWNVNINCKYFGAQEYIRFNKTAEHRVLMFLVAKIVRRPSNDNNYYQNKMYEEWYKKGMLCTRYDQRAIAEIHEWVTKSGPNRRYVARITKKLQDMKLLKMHKVSTTRGNNAYVYQLGYLDGQGNEILFYDTYFSLVVELEKEVRTVEKKTNQAAVIKEYEATMTDHFKEQIEHLHNRTEPTRF